MLIIFTKHILILSAIFSLSYCQYGGSSFLSALRGYGTDACRFVSCPFGQYCINGICSASSSLGGYGSFAGGLGGMYGSSLTGLNGGSYGGGYGSGFGGGIFGEANKLCAETVDCYSGQICQAGRCTFTSGANYYGGASNGYLGGMNPTFAGQYGNRPSGIQMCTLMQDCLNGQICVNGYCSQSNVAYSGSQLFKSPTTCLTGAVCPVGQYCMAGICIQNQLSSTTACASGIVCPYGMNCVFGRCQPSMLYGQSMLYGKRK